MFHGPYPQALLLAVRAQQALQPAGGGALPALSAQKRQLAALLQDAKYDKILHVRASAQRCLAEIEWVPEPAVAPPAAAAAAPAKRQGRSNKR